ncbi:HAD hydrolase-like protein [Alicyclobacillus curvatus]|nr:HAD hydrolase-like protein [Alicyclobacillus curvatus]
MSKRLILFDLDGTLTNPKLGITSGVQHALKKFGIDEPNLAKLESFIGPPLRQTFMEQYGLSEEDAKTAVSYYREYYDPIGWRQNEVYPGIPEALATLSSAGYAIGLATSKPTVFAERILTHFDLRDAFSVVIGSNLDGTREDKAEVIAAALEQSGMAPLVDGAVHSRGQVGQGQTDAGQAGEGERIDGLVGQGKGLQGESLDGQAPHDYDPPAGKHQADNGRSQRGIWPGPQDEGNFVVMVGDRKYDIIGGKKWGLYTVGVTYGFGSRDELESAGPDHIVDHPLALMDAVAALTKRGMVSPDS